MSITRGRAWTRLVLISMLVALRASAQVAAPAPPAAVPPAGGEALPGLPSFQPEPPAPQGPAAAPVPLVTPAPPAYQVVAEQGSLAQSDYPTPMRRGTGMGGLRGWLSQAGLAFSGYGQAEYSAVEGFPSTFLVSHGQVGVGYGTELSRLVIQINAAPKGVGVIDAFVELFPPGTGELHVAASLGLRRLPFGYAVPQDPANNVFLEQPEFYTALFPGLRDLGLFATAAWRVLRLDVAVVNGQGLDLLFVEGDPTPMKNVVTRADLELGWLSLGASGYFGDAIYPDPEHPEAFPRQFIKGPKWVVGLDAIVRTAIKMLGPTTFKAAVLRASTLDVPGAGGSAEVVQALGPRFGAGLRYSFYDAMLGQVGHFSSALDGVLFAVWDEHTRIGIQGTHHWWTGSAPYYDSLTLQAQFRF